MIDNKKVIELRKALDKIGCTIDDKKLIAVAAYSSDDFLSKADEIIGLCNQNINKDKLVSMQLLEALKKPNNYITPELEEQLKSEIENN